MWAAAAAAEGCMLTTPPRRDTCWLAPTPTPTPPPPAPSDDIDPAAAVAINPLFDQILLLLLL